MARPVKSGLVYHPDDVNFYDDLKIIRLLNKFGALGVVVYDVIIKEIYRQGYYLEMNVDELTLIVVRKIGNKWSKPSTVSQVILFCADLDLISKDLLSQGVITSVGIQRRYAEVTSRNKVDKSKYWLLDGEQPLESISSELVSATETRVSVTKTPVSVTKTQQIKEKENKRKLNESKVSVPSELSDAWKAYSEMRVKIKKPMTDHAAQLVLNKLQKLAPNNYSLQNAILEQSTMNSWQGVFPLKEDKTSGWGGEASYDIDELERKLLYGEIKYKEGQ